MSRKRTICSQRKTHLIQDSLSQNGYGGLVFVVLDALQVIQCPRRNAASLGHHPFVGMERLAAFLPTMKKQTPALCDTLSVPDRKWRWAGHAEESAKLEA